MINILILIQHGMAIAAVVVLQYNGADWWHYLYVVILGALTMENKK